MLRGPDRAGLQAQFQLGVKVETDQIVEAGIVHVHHRRDLQIPPRPDRDAQAHLGAVGEAHVALGVERPFERQEVRELEARSPGDGLEERQVEPGARLPAEILEKNPLAGVLLRRQDELRTGEVGLGDHIGVGRILVKRRALLVELGGGQGEEAGGEAKVAGIPVRHEPRRLEGVGTPHHPVIVEGAKGAPHDSGVQIEGVGSPGEGGVHLIERGHVAAAGEGDRRPVVGDVPVGPLTVGEEFTVLDVENHPGDAARRRHGVADPAADGGFHGSLGVEQVAVLGPCFLDHSELGVHRCAEALQQVLGNGARLGVTDLHNAFQRRDDHVLRVRSEHRHLGQISPAFPYVEPFVDRIEGICAGLGGNGNGG